MNFLAHLTLSYFDAGLQVGNFLGDFVKGRAEQDYPPPVRRGIAMHRAIDATTDADPDVRTLNDRVRPRHGRYAPVVTDIAFDYFLYRNWDRFGPADFTVFSRTTYRHLAAAKASMPPRVAGYVNGMVSDDWLQLYTTPGGMARVFHRLRPRLSRPELIDGVEDTLTELAPAFQSTFLTFYPRLQSLAATYRDHRP